MKFSEARHGRVFVLRLEDGEVVHEVLEKFAADQNIEAASLVILGGADDGSTLVVGPEEPRAEQLKPMRETLRSAYEVAGAGTLFCDEEGKPILHMHIVCGRKDETVTGCIREGVKVWQVMEVVIHELADCGAKRLPEEPLGLKLLSP